MILIEEKIPKKLPGLSSLFVSFDYNAEIVGAIKQVGTAIYDKKTKIWEVPITSLADLLDSFCKFDEITLKLLKEKSEKEKEIVFQTKFKTKPFPYQLDGIKFGLQHDRFMLLDVPVWEKHYKQSILHKNLKSKRELSIAVLSVESTP